MLNILFIGDIVGSIGRKACAKIIPQLKQKEKIDFVIANAENAAHGKGVTESVLQELQEAGIDFFTNGDHAFDRTKQLDCYKNFPIIRPLNYSQEAPGSGFKIIKIKNYKFLIINLIGRIFMDRNHDCPFAAIDKILTKYKLRNNKLSAIIIDIHAEASSEKICLKHYLDGKISALLGTHTHIMTADAEITKNGTAYITDVGMVGFAEGSLGVQKEEAIEILKTQIKHQFIIPENGLAIFNSILLKIDPQTGKILTIKPINKKIKIN